MSRRGRAIVFLLAACLCAALAVTIASGYGARIQQRYGSLRTVVIARADLEAGSVIDAGSVNRLEVRRVPVRFAPADAISSVSAAAGQAPAALIPRGSYLLAAQLEAPKEDRKPVPGAGSGRSPVEIAVAGAETLATGDGAARRVDVIVTTEPKGGGSGRTYVAARDIPLLDLARGTDSAAAEAGATDPAAGWTATLALTRDEALRLIAAENFARQVRLLPVPSVSPRARP